LKFYYPDDEYYTYQAPGGSYENSANSSSLGERLRSGVRETVIETLGYPVSLKRWQKMLQPVFTRLFMDQGTRGWRHKLPRYVPNGAALDIGCGNGGFLGLLRHLGWRTKGIEMNGQAAAIAREHFGLDVHQGTIDDFPAGEEKFDYINLSHVLEHVYEPHSFLEKVRDLLTPDGIIYIELPNAESFGQRTSHEFWYPWETPRHIYMFSPKTLSLQVEKAGLMVTRLETTVGNLWPWDATYCVEEAAGEKCLTRPAKTREVRAEASRLARAAAAEFRRDPMSGDIISCWVKKRSVTSA